MTDATWPMERAARRVVQLLSSGMSMRLPAEILRLNEETAGIVIDIDGTDYLVTMAALRTPRVRPANN